MLPNCRIRELKSQNNSQILKFVTKLMLPNCRIKELKSQNNSQILKFVKNDISRIIELKN